MTCLFERSIYVFETCQYVLVREPPLATQQQNPQRTMSLATKTGGPAAGIAASLRKELQSLDPDSALYNPPDVGRRARPTRWARYPPRSGALRWPAPPASRSLEWCAVYAATAATMRPSIFR